ncbi:GNAT family N-acetyltransferase [Sphingomonas oligophenolica]|uniref:GNAT family N-acetyltransferase n=1 Tax=Sphingomonas oligophenolica TaxID=301154 RepID=A0A502CQK5_9SPHN|nr:GNAT family N-acetyltransferase [Sphingomonas oligophenolica]TPG15507.1 GNAT family N-acetyltransferase [Sphingomonas oligophenolica]
MKIRFATPDDVATILRFIRDLAEYEREADKVVATEALLAEALFATPPAAGIHQSSTLMGPAAEALIAERDGPDGIEPIGMALFFHNFSTWTGWRGLYLEDLYVTPEARGSGAGTALLKRLAAIAKERNCSRFEWSVLTWNTPAIEFYRSLGAVSMEDWRINRVTGDALDRLAESG